MARLVYACRFEIPAGENLDPASAEYRNWLVNHYRKRHRLSSFEFDPSQMLKPDGLPDDHNLSWKNYSCEKGSAFQILWSFPHHDDQGLHWFHDIRAGRFENRCSIEHQIQIKSVDYSISPARLHVGSPHVIRNLCAMSNSYIDEMSVRAIPYEVGADELRSFLVLLFHKNRKLPIIFLSPYEDGKHNLIDAEQLAKNLAGVAIVVPVVDPQVTWDFTDRIGRYRSCFNGGARIYWPRFSWEDNPRSHRLFLGSKIEEEGLSSVRRAIERAVFDVAAFRFFPEPRISEVIREANTIERQKRAEHQKALNEETWETYAQELDEEMEIKNKRIAELEAENKNLKENQKNLLATGHFSEKEDDEYETGYAENKDVEIESVTMALYKAEGETTNLEILRSAFSSARESPFLRPRKIYQALHDLNNFVNDRRNGKTEGETLIKYLRNRGWKRSKMRISETARGMYRSDYEFMYRGEKKLFAPHITFGAGDFNTCASIHFLFDQDREKIVVAHCGKHLRNTKT